MVGALVAETAREQPRIAAIQVHPPNTCWPASLGAAENDVLAVRRFARAKIPDRRLAMREVRNTPIARVEPADVRAAAGKVRLDIAIKVIGIRTLRLEFPRSEERRGGEVGQ